MTDTVGILARGIDPNAFNICANPACKGCETSRQYARNRATDALEALELAGLVVVSREPTEEMLDSGADAYHTACEAEKERRAEQGRRPRAFPNDWLPAVYRAMLLVGAPLSRERQDDPGHIRPADNDERNEMFDVIEVMLRKPHPVRVIERNKTESDAEAIVKMAVMRYGVEYSFFKKAPAGKYDDDDTIGSDS